MAKRRPKSPASTKANTPSDDIMMIIKDVAEQFEIHREPWPDENQCYSLAICVQVIRDRKKYKEDFERDNRPLRKRRAFVKSMKQFVKKQQSLGTAISLQDAEDLAVLEKALENATSALLAPFDPRAGVRDKAWWHKAAGMIAEHTEATLVQAGHKRISKQKHGAFVNVVAGLLKLATGEDFEPATIAHVLTQKLNRPRLMG